MPTCRTSTGLIKGASTQAWGAPLDELGARTPGEPQHHEPRRWQFAASLVCALGACALTASAGAAQGLTGQSLLGALRAGGHVLVMRHARSPQEFPTPQTAATGNSSLERQLDAEGQRAAVAMGVAIQALGVPIGDVLVSPSFRARQTALLARFPRPQPTNMLGDDGRRMAAAATDAQVAWLVARTHAPARANTILLTHSPNIAGAFPDAGTIAEGETLVVRAGRVVARVRIEEWPLLAR